VRKPGAWSASRLFEFNSKFEPPERVIPRVLEHLADGPERFPPGDVEALLLVWPAIDETRGGERSKMRRHGAERDVRHRRVYASRRQLVMPHQPQDLAPARRSDGGEDVRLKRHTYNLD
jgi:hypothetical protein